MPRDSITRSTDRHEEVPFEDTDAEDLAAFEERADEPVMTYEELLKSLKKDGKV